MKINKDTIDATIRDLKAKLPEGETFIEQLWAGNQHNIRVLFHNLPEKEGTAVHNFYGIPINIMPNVVPYNELWMIDSAGKVVGKFKLPTE